MARFYLSNLSETWPIVRQESLLDETCPGWRDQAVYRDILSLRGLTKGERLAERDDFLLRRAGRTEDGGEVVVATLLAIARTQTDLTSVLVRLAGRREKLRSIAEAMVIDPATQDLDEMKRAFHNAARRFSAKGVPGGVASGQRRSEAARARIREFIKPMWHLPLPSVAALCKKYKVSRPTVIDELGNRKEAQQRYVDDLRKQMRALKVAEANRKRKKPVQGTVPLNQCEYPDLRGRYGDTCTNLAPLLRQTEYGTLWLCHDHYEAPVEELFDPREEGKSDV